MPYNVKEVVKGVGIGLILLPFMISMTWILPVWLVKSLAVAGVVIYVFTGNHRR